ncbi:PREDICTED: T-cell immunoglobulin and mucin domain-containing protein 4-like [Nanorana parkeri]|uniref:T-cell immunoglobulin and mucin domain-containing protein 4-like n=1 Tax=Nanorana parkeri TaxID=125878 RepID=UPI00085429D6|nr:PREDICTED: T-cell immunoglobulin and mucin domain-containing protein 4-like [Nanorana parkeri]
MQTDGSKVTWRKSDTYQLLGNITQGDVSLTLTVVSEKDGGTYCCRVDIPGWFNDLKENIDVKIIKRYEDTTRVTEQVTTRREETSNTDVNTSGTFTTITVKTTFIGSEESEKLQDDPKNVAVYVITLVLFILLVSLMLYTWKFYKAKKTKADSNALVINIDVLGSEGNQATDNIYT